jgi:putative ABC transport system permease protein
MGIITGMTIPGKGQQLTNLNFVTSGYFDVMKMRVVAGRTFQAADKPGAKPVPVVVNEEFVRRFLESRNAVGTRIGRDGDRQIVGVVNDTYYRSLRESPPPIVYESDFGPEAYPRPFVLHIRFRYPPQAAIETIRAALQQADPKLPIYEASTVGAEMERSMWTERVTVKLAGWFGLFALFLSATGIYGALARHVFERRREIGVRLALGASALRMISDVLSRIAPAVTSGVGIGLATYLVAGRWIQPLFFGVRFADPVLIGFAVLVIALTALGAAVVPVYRALSLDPVSILKQE